jgi:protein-L-isoaspartate O-methyltransferase
MPVGKRRRQQLTLVTRVDGGYETAELEAVVFVPLIGEHGFAAEPDKA